nr:DNRLRE domain-containing protein [Oscillospiraceae bacterium]
MKHMKKLVSILLSLAISWNLASPSLASNNVEKIENSLVDSQTQKQEDASFYETASISSYTAKDILWEEEDRREESVKHFRMTDGSFLAVEYGEPVHVLDANGTYEEIDNSLSSDSKAAITAANSILPVRFAESTRGDALVQIGSGDSLFSMTPYSGLPSRDGLNGAEATGNTELPEASADNPEALRMLPVMDTAEVSARINNSISEKAVSDSASVEEATRPGHIYSSVQYSEIFPSVNLEYVLTPTALKENIVINGSRPDYRFSFTLDLGEMKPERNEDGSVSVYLNGEPVYYIPAPFMFDAAGSISQNVHYSLTEYGYGTYILTVDPDRTWIESKERLFPVTIDPNVIWQSGRNGVSIDSSYITSFYPDYPMGNTSTYVGRGHNGTTYGVYRAFYKLRQYPSLPNNSTIIGATLKLKTMNFSGFDEINLIATAVAPIAGISGSDFSITGLTWNTCPELEADALDYAVFHRKGGLLTYSWNITRKLIDWYDDPDSNYGLMLSAKDEETLAAWVQFYPTGSVYPPAISVSYRNNVGLEPYYTCRSIDMGRAGTAYLGDYSGALTAMKTDIYAASTTNPVGLNHVYHSDLARVEYTSYLNGAYASMRLGAGWQLDCMESVSRDGNYVCYFDGDGTLHMFHYDRTRQAYVDEDGLGLTITEDGVNTNCYDLSDRYGNQKRFEGGLLQYDRDRQGNRVIYHYENGQLTRITRQNDQCNAELIATLRYDANHYLASVTDSASNTTAFSYTDANGLVLLSTITHPDGTTVSYTYHENGKLHTATDRESGLRYEFSYAAQSGKVSMIRQFSGETLGLLYGANGSYAGIQAYRYAGANRTFSSSDYMTGGNQDDDTDDILTFFVFDSTGRTINSYVTDYKKETIYSATADKYNANDNIDPRKNNRVTLQSGLNLLAENRLPENPEPGSNGGWTLSSGAVYDESTQMLRFTGDPTKTVTATRTVLPKEEEQGSYILSAFSKAASVPLSASDGKTWALRATLYYFVLENGKVRHEMKSFDISYAADSTSWQYLMLPICVPQEDAENASVNRIEITLEYGKNLNEALFARVSLVPGVSQSYGYSDAGDVTGISATDMGGVKYTYDIPGYIKEYAMVHQNEKLYCYQYNYDDDLNLDEIINKDVSLAYTYDDAGNPTGTVLSAAGYEKQIVTAAVYDANGNRVLTETDARGNSTQYAYSNAISRQTGNPSKVTNANNTVVNYTYNAQNGRLTRAAIPSTVSLDYAYSSGRLSMLTRKSYTGSTQKTQRYYLNYDLFGNLTGVSVGASAAKAWPLVSHSYAHNNGVLEKTYYPN